MENKIFEEKQEQEQGWRDVLITPDMPLAAIVQFLNILNQRLCAIEDNLLIELPTGERMSLTKAYQLQAQQEQEQSKGE